MSKDTEKLKKVDIDDLKIDHVKVTATADELNKLDGLTADVAELNKVDGLTSDPAELNKLDGVVAGTASASKAVVLGTNKDLDELHLAKLFLGSDAGTEMTKTAAELNALLAAVTAGKKIAFGTKTIGAASEDVVTGLTTVEHCFVSMVGDPSATHCMSTCTPGNQTDAPVAGSIRIKSWKFTAANDNALIAADSVFANVAWFAIGS